MVGKNWVAPVCLGGEHGPQKRRCGFEVCDVVGMSVGDAAVGFGEILLLLGLFGVAQFFKENNPGGRFLPFWALGIWGFWGFWGNLRSLVWVSVGGWKIGLGGTVGLGGGVQAWEVQVVNRAKRNPKEVFETLVDCAWKCRYIIAFWGVGAKKGCTGGVLV